MKDGDNKIQQRLMDGAPSGGSDEQEYKMLFDMLNSYQSQYDLPIHFAESVSKRLTDIQQLTARENRLKLLGIGFLVSVGLISMLVSGVELKSVSMMPYIILFGGLVLCFHFIEKKMLAKPLSQP